MSLSNIMVVHVWANQSKPKGRSSNGNASFEGPVLYSYAEPIGRIVETVTGARAYLISTRNWSVTTSAHQSAARGAVPSEFAAYSVPDVGRYGPPDHAVNLAATPAARAPACTYRASAVTAGATVSLFIEE